MMEKKFVEDILSIKNYQTTYETFSLEKDDKPKKKSRYFVDTIFVALNSLDLENLQKQWSSYEQLYFVYLDFQKQKTANHFKNEIYKSYLVECVRNKRFDKIAMFCSSMGDYMAINYEEWLEWRDFFHLKNHMDHRLYARYFERSWTETLKLALLNFFMQVVRIMMTQDSLIDRFFNLDQKYESQVEVGKSQSSLFSTFPQDDEFLREIRMRDATSYVPRLLHDEPDIFWDFKDIGSFSIPMIDQRQKTAKSRKPTFPNLKINRTSPLVRPKIDNSLVECESAPSSSVPVSSSNTSDSPTSNCSMSNPNQNSSHATGLLIENSNSSITSDSDSTIIIDNTISMLPSHEELESRVKEGQLSPEMMGSSNSSDTFKFLNFPSRLSNKFLRPKSSSLSSNQNQSNDFTNNQINNTTITLVQSLSPLNTIGSPTNRASSVYPMMLHEHFSMVSHLKISKIPSSVSSIYGNSGVDTLGPDLASLDVGGTFKVWSTFTCRANNDLNSDSSTLPNQASMSQSKWTLTPNHAIYSFDWVNCLRGLILLGTKNGFVKLFDTEAGCISHEMKVTSSHPRIHKIHSLENDTKFVCESLDRTRSNFTSISSHQKSHPSGIMSLYDVENWNLVRENIVHYQTGTSVNCINSGTASHPYTLVCGYSNGTIQISDLRDRSATNSSIHQVFSNMDEIVDVSSISDNRWLHFSTSSNVGFEHPLLSSINKSLLFCLNGNGVLKILDIRKLSGISNRVAGDSFRSSELVGSSVYKLPDLQLPLRWAEKPNGGGEQTVRVPRSSLIAPVMVGGCLGVVGAAGRKISFQNVSYCNSLSNNEAITTNSGSNSLSTSPIQERPQFFNCDHTSPIISLDCVPVVKSDSQSSSPHSILCASGSMEGTVSIVKLDVQNRTIL